MNFDSGSNTSFASKTSMLSFPPRKTWVYKCMVFLSNCGTILFASLIYLQFFFTGNNKIKQSQPNEMCKVGAGEMAQR